MDYIYDVILNFQENYYDFYEWYPHDKLINVKKIPIYKITNKDYLNIKNNDTYIDKNSLPKQNKMLLLTSGYEILGILLDDSGKVLKKSSLIFEEADDILSDIDEIKNINIKYSIIKKNKPILKSRLTNDHYLYVSEYLNKLDKEKDKYLLKYLYYEIYHLEEDNLTIIYNKLLSLRHSNLSLIYETITNLNKKKSN